MKEDNIIQVISSAMDAHGFTPLTVEERNELRTDPRTADYLILKRQLKDLGFGDVLAESLWQQMREQEPKILLPYSALMGQDIVACELSFSRSSMGNYFMNQYTIDLSGMDEQTGLKFKRQTIPVEFYQTADRTLTLNESYNLLKGRWVNKQVCDNEGEYYADWIKYDMTNVTQSGSYQVVHLGKDRSFNVTAHLSKLPFADFGIYDNKEQLAKALSEGNREAVNMLLFDGSKTRLMVEVNPLADKLEYYLGKRKVHLTQDGKIHFPGSKNRVLESVNAMSKTQKQPGLEQQRKRKRIRRL